MIKRDNTKFISNTGDPMIPRYKPVIDEYGHMELEVSGYDDIRDIINSFADQTDIRVILARVKAGEVDLLEKTKGVFGDFTGTPKTLAEALQLQIDSGRLFDSLDPDVRMKFNNDPKEFFAQSGTEDWFKKLGSTLPEQMRSMNNTPPAQGQVDAQTSTTDETKVGVGN